jgi:putative transposase
MRKWHGLIVALSKGMSRIPRNLTIRPGFPVHKIWRGHNRENNIERDSDKEKYLEFLNDDYQKHKAEIGAKISALTLMSNHAHEVFQVLHQQEFSNHMRRHHARYGAYFNKDRGRSGKVAEDRPKTCLIGDDTHMMRVTFYVHANPVRAGMVKNARDYQWSTHRLYAFGIRDEWMKFIQLPGWYMRLGKNMAQRQRRYRELYERYLKEDSRRSYGATILRSLFLGPKEWQDECLEEVKLWREEHCHPD